MAEHRPPRDPRPRGPVQTVWQAVGLAVFVGVSAVAELLDEVRSRG